MTPHTLPPEVKVLLDWIDTRGQPDSGIRYEAGSHANTRGIRHSLSHVQLHGTDADFIAKHFHGEGARNLAAALRSALEPSGEGVGAEVVAWRKGMRVEATASMPGEFTKGRFYELSHDHDGSSPTGSVRVVADDTGQPNGWSLNYFRLAQPLSGMEGRLRPAFELLVKRVARILGDLGPGGYLLPSGAVKTNALKAALNEARIALSAPVSAASPEGEAGKWDDARINDWIGSLFEEQYLALSIVATVFETLVERAARQQ